MTFLLNRGYQGWCLVGLVGLWALALAQSCDRHTERADTDREVVEAAADGPGEADGHDSPSDDQTTLPGGVEPGSIQPDRAGPKSPAVFFLASLEGYLEPCGCSAEVLLGGIDRIVGYARAAAKLYTDTTMLDAGDMLFEDESIEPEAIAQQEAKLDVLVAAQQALGTRVTVPGERDFALGAEVYSKTLARTDARPIAANMTIDGASVPATAVIELGGIKLGVVGAVDPSLYESVDGVQARAPTQPVTDAVTELKSKDAHTIVLLMHGDLGATRKLLGSVGGIDFGIVGHAPRQTDQVYAVAGGHTLEAFDQGRYLGVLQLYARSGEDTYTNAGAASQTEIEKVQRLISHKKNQLRRFPPSKRKESPPILDRLKRDIDKYEKRLDQLRAVGVDVPESGNAFVYRPIAMEPGLPVSQRLQKRRNAYNEHLEELQRRVDRQIPPVEDGHAFFVGSTECARCHSAAYDFWKNTRHAQAVETLRERNKLFDQGCIGCHVVGYEKPGGSVIGKLHYEAQVGGRSIDKNLEDVGCENCHGPGSNHVQAPVDSSGTAQHIDANPGKQACMQCHVSEHSPAFNFEAYRQDITGPGHAMSDQ